MDVTVPENLIRCLKVNFKTRTPVSRCLKNLRAELKEVDCAYESTATNKEKTDYIFSFAKPEGFQVANDFLTKGTQTYSIRKLTHCHNGGDTKK